jgi:hypothetical protein
VAIRVIESDEVLDTASRELGQAQRLRAFRSVSMTKAICRHPRTEYLANGYRGNSELGMKSTPTLASSCWVEKPLTVDDSEKYSCESADL